MHRLFLSHASSDVKLVGIFSELLELGIGLAPSETFCSSVASQGVAPGSDFKSYMHARLRESSIALALVTPHFYESTFCLCEIGAAWGMSIETVPLLAPPLGSDDLKGALAGTQAVSLDRSNDLDLLRDKIVGTLSLNSYHPVAKWNAAKHQFIDRLPEVYRTITPQRRRGQTFLREYLTEYVRTLQYSDERIWIVLFDIDGQGQINRAHGVEFGNRILARMAEAMFDGNRVARWIGQCGDDTFFAICVGPEGDVGAYGRRTLSKIKDRFSEGTAYVSATGCAVNRRRMSGEYAWIRAAGEKLREAQRACRGAFLMTEFVPRKDRPVHESGQGKGRDEWPFS